MKNLSRYIWFIVLLTIAIPSCSWGQLLKDRTEYISFFLNEPLDSAGVELKPDSAHVFTYADNGSAKAYSARSTTWPFSDISIDTLKEYGDTMYVFADAIADIDAGSESSLAIVVKLFCDGLPRYTHQSIQIISDSLIEDLDAIAVIDGVVDGIQTEVDNIDGSAIPTDESIAQAVMDSVRNETVADTATGALWAWLVERADEIENKIDIVDGNVDEIETSTDSIETAVADGHIVKYAGPAVGDAAIIGDYILRVNGFYTVADDNDTAAFYVRNDGVTSIGFQAIGGLCGILGYSSGSNGTGIFGWAPDGWGMRLHGNSSLYDLYLQNKRIYANIYGWMTPTDTTKGGYSIAAPGDVMVADDTTKGGYPIPCDGTGWNVYLAVIDSSGGDTLVPFVRTVFKNSNGVEIIHTEGSDTGIDTVGVPEGTYVLTSYKQGYVFNSHELALTSDSADTVWGYNIPVPSAQAPQTCAVTVNIVDNDGNPAVGVKVSAYIGTYRVVDSLGNAVNNPIKEEWSNSNGQVTFTCIWSSYLIPASNWIFSARSSTIGYIYAEVTVPRQTSYTVDLRP